MLKKSNTSNPNFHYWLNTLSFGAIIFLFVCYYYFFQGENLSFEFINRATAATAIILIGLSFALSGLGYYWDFLDKKVTYRKYLGIIGYFFVLWHALNSLYYYFFSDNQLPKFNVNNYWNVFGYEVSNLVPFVLGALSLSVFTFMALISNSFATKKIGGVRWRKLLRLGYLALFFGLIHFTIKNLQLWLNWINDSPKSLPEMSMLLAIYIPIILLLRLSLEVSIRKNKPKLVRNFDNKSVKTRKV